MKKIFAALTAVFLTVLCLSLNVSAYSAGIDDQAGLYTSEQLEELEKRQQEVADLTGWNIKVVTTNVGFGEDGYNAVEYAEQYYDDTFGYSSSGILYLIDIDYRHFCISGTADYEYFNDYRVEKMIDACNEKYYAYDDVGHLNTFYDEVEYYYNEGPFTSKNEGKFSFAAAFIVGLIAAGIAAGVVVSKYKFHEKPGSANYIDRSSMNMYLRSDRFVREYTTRHKVESSSGGGGGGHGSSGGHSHGGGGSGGRR